MKLCFDSVDEVRAFVKDELKGGRGRGRGKDDDGADETGAQPQTGAAPAPIQPPPTGQALPGNNAMAGGPPYAPAAAFTPAAPPPAATMPAVVGRIASQVDKLIAGQVPGQPAQPEAAVLDWLRKQLAPFDASAANATLDQVKQVYLNKLPEQALNQIAGMIGA